MRRLQLIIPMFVLISCSDDGDVTPPVANAIRFSQVTVGYFHSCGLATSGIVYCWGFNTFGTLGDGTRTTRLVPTAIATSMRYRELDGGAGHNCALTAG